MINLLRYLKNFKFSIGVSLLLIAIRALAELYLPTLSADMVNIGIVNRDIEYILHVGSWMLIITAAGIAAFILAGYLSSKATAGFARILREEVFSRVESFSLQEFDRFGTASLINRTTNDITQVQNFLVFALRMIVMVPILGAGCIVLAFSRDAILALVFVVVTPVILAVIFFFMRQGLPLFKIMQEKLDRLNLIVREGLTGIRVIRAFNRDSYEKQRFERANFEYAATGLRVNRLMEAMTPLITLIMNLSIIAIVWFGGIRIDLGFTNVGDLMAFIQYAMQVLYSFIAISRMFLIIPRATASAARINEVLNTKPQILDGPAEKQPQDQKTRGHVEFKDVTFRYPEAKRPVLRNISFRAGPGEVTAIIGSTGSGKSTLVHLMLRLYDVDSGSILIDGVDVREMPQKSLREKISFVPQKTILFSGTILDNICYGREDAGSEEVLRAAEIAQAMEFISEMKDGFSSPVAQGGKNLSGGQRQRLAIARALLKKADIYIFDDSFSALDYATEARLRRALAQEMAGATLFIISQRINTVKNADRIIVLDKGRIAGIGTHEELMASCDIYREIVVSQLSEEETA
ncbi:MAG: ABC transporter ATP-binding protein [Firmicutes bacterium]|nr:ABC transporter ATP-binding protein [Bacillota bacterium]